MTSSERDGDDFSNTTMTLMTSYGGNASSHGNDSMHLIVDIHRSPTYVLSWYIVTPGAAIAMIPFGLLTLVVNVITCLALIAERALQTTLYTYLASLAACDVIGAAIITPLAAASLYYDSDSVGGRRVGEVWYTLDTFLRTAQLLHFVIASLDAFWQLSGARNLLQYQSKRYFATSGPRHVIPRRSLAPRVVITWLTTAIMAISPFIWYQFFANSTTGNGWSGAGRQSNVRKLVLLVFVLSFAMPLISAIASYCLLLRTWLLVRKECSLAVVISKSGLTRTGSTVSRRSVRGAGPGGPGGPRSRQASVRASRRSRGGGRSHGGGGTSSGGLGGSGGSAMAGGGGGIKSSPQLDRHPSVRYSIRRHGGPGGRRDGSRTSIDRDSAEASLLAEVIAAENVAAMQDCFDANGGSTPAVPLSALFQQDNFMSFGTAGGVVSRTGSRRDSPKSTRSSRSEHGGVVTTSGPETSPTTKPDNPSPTRRFTKQKQPLNAATLSANNTNVFDDSTSGSAGYDGGRAVDPYFLLSGLQAVQRRPPLSAQRSNPEVTMFGSPDIVGVGLSPRGSRDELVKALIGGGVVKKRSFIRRHSSRARRSHQPSGHDSPCLDRHPSLRYSTTRLQTTASSSSSRGDRHSTHIGGSIFSQRGIASCSTLSVGTARHCVVGSSSATSGTAAATTCVGVGAATVDRKESSGSNASSSIGTCHDLLQPSASTYSMSRGGGHAHQYRRGGRLQLDSTGSSPETDCEAAADGGGGGVASLSRTGSRSSSGRQAQRRSAEDHQALLAERARRNISNVNLLRLAPSDRDASPGEGPRGVRRNRSAEDFGTAAAAAANSVYRSSSNRLSPASCRRQRPVTPDKCIGGPAGSGASGGIAVPGGGIGGWGSNSSNHHLHLYRRDRLPSDSQRAVPLDSVSGDRYVPHGATDTDQSDLSVAGSAILILLVLWLPVLVVELTAALRFHCGAVSTQCHLSSVETWHVTVSSLHAVGYLGGILRPIFYQIFNRTLRLAILRVICRQ